MLEMHFAETQALPYSTLAKAAHSNAVQWCSLIKYPLCASH